MGLLYHMRYQNLQRTIKICFLLSLLLTFNVVHAQVRQIQSIDPDNKEYSDLNFLRQELSDKTVVMLGEPSHREGNVFSAKIRMIKFLHEQMGFNVIAFESGFFEVQQAQQKINGGGDVVEALDLALFPIWTRSAEFRPLMEYIKAQKNSLKIMGFDPQINQQVVNDFLPALKKYVVDRRVSYNLNDMLLSEVLESLSEGVFPDGITFPAFTAELKKAKEILKNLSASDSKSAGFWLQNLKSLEALATDYYRNRPSEKSAEDFKASDSNPRDLQMADNLSYYIRQYPNEKIICWGAALHFAMQPSTLENNELKSYKPMGQSVREVVGNDRVYTLATTSAAGTYASWFDTDSKPVPKAATGSLEEMFVENNLGDYQYMDAKTLNGIGVRESTMFDYIPLRGDWSKVVNGILYFKTYAPVLPVLQKTSDQDVPQGNEPLKNINRLMPDSKSLLKIRKSGAFVTSGNITDAEDGQPIASATLKFLLTKESAISDLQGNFVFSSNTVTKGAMISVSSIGYMDTTIKIGDTPLSIKLKKASIDLEDIQIRPSDENAVQIIKKTFAAIDTHLNQDAYGMAFYVDTKVADLDSTTYHLEYTGTFYKQKKSRDKYLSKVLELHWLKKSKSSDQQIRNSIRYLDGYQHINGGNVVLQHPMFDTKVVGKYRYEILEDTGENYIIGFESRTRAHSVTNGYYLKRFSGSIIISKADYAIMETTLNYQLDTTTLNRFARNFDKRKGDNASIFLNILDNDEVTIKTAYNKYRDGYYYPAQTTVIRNQKGVDIDTAKPILLKSETRVYFMDAKPEDASIDNFQKVINFNQVKYNISFWKGFRRPV